MHDAAGSRNAVLAVTRRIFVLASRVQIIEAQRVPYLMPDDSISLAIGVYAVVVRLPVTASTRDFGDGIDEVVVVEGARFW